MEILLLSSLLFVLLRLGAAQYTFTIRGSSSTAVLGSPYSFTCVQSGTLPGTPAPSLRFVKDGTQPYCTAFRTQCSPSFPSSIPCGCVDSSGGNYMYRYNISSVTLEHTGSWICGIATDRGNVNTDPFQLIVPVHPSMTLVNNSRLSVTEGQPVTLTCEATGLPVPNITWSRNGTQDSSGNRSSLTFTPDRRDGNSQTVTCTASNSAGTDSASYFLNVQYLPDGRPIISSTPPVNEGSDVTLTCDVTGGNPPVSSVTLTCPRGHTNTESGTLVRLQFTADRRDQGPCNCSASHVLGYTQTASINILVHYAPDVTVAVSSQGQGQVITCSAEGRPPTYTFQPWLQTWGGQEVRRVPGSQQGGQYSLTLTSYQDTGTYSCSMDNRVTDRQGQLIVSNASTNVSVKDSPQFPKLPDTQVGDIGEEVRLYGTVYSYPALTNHTWYFNSVPVPASGSYISSRTRARIRLSVHGQEVTTDGWNMTLDVTVRPDTTGAYRLQACNSLSCQSTSVRLLATGPPYPPESLGATSTSDSIELSWQPGFSGGDFFQWFHIQYRRQDSQEGQWSDVSNVGNRSSSDRTRVTVTVEGLEPDTSYVFRVRAQNSRPQKNLSNYTMLIMSTKAESRGLGVGGVAAVTGVVVFLLTLAGTLAVVYLVLRHRQHAGTKTNSQLYENRAFDGEALRNIDQEDRTVQRPGARGQESDQNESTYGVLEPASRHQPRDSTTYQHLAVYQNQ